MDGMVMNKSVKVGKGKKKKGLITKTWERCKSIGRGYHSSSSSVMMAQLPLPLPLTTTAATTTRRSKSWPSLRVKKGGGCSVAPEGCFSVYVGPQMQRFVIKTEYANHPLFKMLLEEAESEYGYRSQGPLALPCDVDVFCKVLMEIDYDEKGSAENNSTRQGCAFGKRSRSTYHLLSPNSRMLAINHFS